MVIMIMAAIFNYKALKQEYEQKSSFSKSKSKLNESIEKLIPELKILNESWHEFFDNFQNFLSKSKNKKKCHSIYLHGPPPKCHQSGTFLIIVLYDHPGDGRKAR